MEQTGPRAEGGRRRGGWGRPFFMPTEVMVPTHSSPVTCRANQGGRVRTRNVRLVPALLRYISHRSQVMAGGGCVCETKVAILTDDSGCTRQPYH